MNQQQIETAVAMRAQDKSYGEIAATIGLNKGTVYAKLQKDELNQLIKQAQNDLIKNSLQDAIENQTDKIKAGKKILQKIENNEKLAQGAVKVLELAHDAEGKLLQSVGIHPSHTQSIQINNILVDARSELSPAVEALLMQHISSNVIDVEP